MQVNEFLRPYNFFEIRKNSMGSIINQFDKRELPDNAFCIAGLSDMHGHTASADNIRKTFYNLAKPRYASTIVDLGNIISGSIHDQQEILSFLNKELKARNSLLILLTANNLKLSDDFCASIMQDSSIVVLHNTVSDSEVDAPIPVNLSYIGIQSYYDFSGGESFNRQILGLGQFRDQKNDAEPFFRSASGSIINFNSVRYSDFPDTFSMNPNGFYAEEICHLAWFAANSNTQNFIILKGYDLSSNVNNPSINLVSQIIWFLNDGYSKRVFENPAKTLNGFKEYHIENNKIPEKLVFYQSVRTNKFWFKYGQNSFVACTKQDMNDVLESNIPGRLWKKIHNS